MGIYEKWGEVVACNVLSCCHTFKGGIISVYVVPIPIILIKHCVPKRRARPRELALGGR